MDPREVGSLENSLFDRGLRDEWRRSPWGWRFRPREPQARPSGQYELPFFNAHAAEGVVGDQEIAVQIGEIDQRGEVRGRSHRHRTGDHAAQHGFHAERLAIGAQLTVKAGGLFVYREVKGSEGFGSTSSFRQHFGLGGNTKIDSLEIRWPSGMTHQFTALDANQIVAVKEDEQQWTRVK